MVLGAAAALAVVTLAGCGEDDPADAGAMPSGDASVATGEPTDATEPTSAAPAETSTPPTTSAAPETSEDPGEWRIRPGGLGPITVGTNAADLIADGYAEELDPPDVGCVEIRYQAVAGLGDVVFAFDRGDPEDLDQITVHTSEGYPTAEGIAVGSTRAEVLDAYPDATSEPYATEGGAPYDATPVFGPDGVLVIVIENFPAEDRVVQLIAVPGTEDDYELPPSGC